MFGWEDAVRDFQLIPNPNFLCHLAGLDFPKKFLNFVSFVLKILRYSQLHFSFSDHDLTVLVVLLVYFFPRSCYPHARGMIHYTDFLKDVDCFEAGFEPTAAISSRSKHFVRVKEPFDVVLVGSNYVGAEQIGFADLLDMVVMEIVAENWVACSHRIGFEAAVQSPGLAEFHY